MWVGQPIRRLDDGPLVRGRGQFIADVASRATALKFVRSSIARGRIVGIESPADTVIFAASDLVGVRQLRPLLNRPDFTPVDQSVLAREEVHYVGQPVAVVVAETMYEAEDKADRVVLNIEPLPPILDVEAALAPGATRVHSHVKENTLIDARLATPGLAQAFAAAAEIVEVELRSHRESAMPLEARGAHAAVDPRTGRITLTSSTQAPHLLRTVVADLLGMPEADLRVIAPDLGGAFGQKQCIACEDVVTVWVARRIGRNVAWIEDRRENFTSSFHSRDQIYTVRGAFSKDGALIAIEGDVRCNVGAYHCYPVTAGTEVMMALSELAGPYRCQEYGVRSRAITTNTCPMAPYRGVSRPNITLVHERLMDLAAKRLNLDPIEIRRRNLIQSFPHTSATGVVHDKGSYIEALDQAVRIVDLPGFRRRQVEELSYGRYIGIGFSTFTERTGYGTSAFVARRNEVVLGYEQVELSIDPSGYAELRIGTSPHGQGLQTTLAQVVADELGMEPKQIRVVHGDTDRTPYGWGTFASRSMVLSGGAALLAAREMRRKFTSIAAAVLEADEDDICLEQGRLLVRGTDRSISLTALARIAYHQTQKLPAGQSPGLFTSAHYDPIGTVANACHVAIVGVDIETGKVTIERFIVVEDAGRLINPLIADGQIHGGVAQGIASALFEELVYDDSGNLLTASMMDYFAPTLTDIPEIEVHHLESLSDATLTGAKGLGEGGTIGAPAAVLNAIVDALEPLGVDIFETPASPQRLRERIRASLST